MEEFTLDNKLTKSDYRNLQMNLTYSKAWMIGVSLFAAIFIITSIILALIDQYEVFNSIWYTLGFVISVAAIYAPLSAYIFSGISYKKNQRLQELITYSFSEQGVEIKGESFTSTFTWNKLYKVKSLKGWLLLYQNWLAANVIKIENEDLEKIVQLKTYLKDKNFKMKIK